MAQRLKSWTVKETAFILSYPDYCLDRNIAYRKTVEAALRKAGGAFVYSQVYNRLHYVVKRICCAKVFDSKRLLSEGTAYLNTSELEPALVQAINKQRKECKMPELTIAAPSVSNPPGNAVRSIKDGNVSATAWILPRSDAEPQRMLLSCTLQTAEL